MRGVILTVWGLSSIASWLVVVRAGGSTRVVGRTVGDLSAIRKGATLAGSAGELFRVPVAFRASGLAICQVVADDVLPF